MFVHNDPRVKPGPGRPKGLLNQRPLAQREFAERICYGVDGKGREEFETKVRALMLAGVLDAGIFKLVLYYLLGKPVERIEVSDKTDDASDLTQAEVIARASALLVAVKESQTNDELPPPAPQARADNNDTIN